MATAIALLRASFMLVTAVLSSCLILLQENVGQGLTLLLKLIPLAQVTSHTPAPVTTSALSLVLALSPFATTKTSPS
jgi:hypothetical protein